ncbi:MAG: hypothetical protein ABW123_11760 [Cystobacter sp.]
MSADTQTLREQFDRLQEALSTRQSTELFAHAGGAFIVALILGGATGKLFWDSLRTPWLAWLGLLATVALIVFGMQRLGRARAVLADELARYATMLELRRQLGLDNPSVLLPR